MTEDYEKITDEEAVLDLPKVEPQWSAPTAKSPPSRSLFRYT